MRSHQESNPSSNWLDAGRSLRVPKSTLSHRLQELEKSLGVRLLNRTSRRFGMTEAGGEFYRHSVAMLREAERAETAMRHRLHEATGTVRCTASLATMQFAISEVLIKLPRPVSEGERRGACDAFPGKTISSSGGSSLGVNDRHVRDGQLRALLVRRRDRGRRRRDVIDGPGAAGRDHGRTYRHSMW